MEDIAPGLVENVTEEFHRLYNGSSKIKSLLEKVKAGTATYAEAQGYSLEVSRLIGAAYEKHISSAVLPDGRMYYNIASRLIPSTLDESYSLVSEYTVNVQQKLNEQAKIGLKAQAAEKNQDRIDGLVDLASSAEQCDDVSEKLLTAFENFSQNIVDETLKVNADFQYNAGLTPKIIRKAGYKCCEWCARLVGEFNYPDVPDDIYRRHERCHCIVEYDPGDGRRQNVHTKQWTGTKNRGKMEKRKQVGLHGVSKSSTSLNEVVNALRNGNLKDAINEDLQGPHSIDSGMYKAGKSYLYGGIDEAQELFDKLKGTGDPVFDKNGSWQHKERVVNDTPVGVWVSNTGESEETKAAMIIYSKTGSHIYPRKEES